MTKSELINAIHNYTGGNKKDVEIVLDGLGIVIREQLHAGGEVTLPGIGKLSVKHTAARQGRNPATGEAITIPAGKKVHFSAAKALKDAVA